MTRKLIPTALLGVAGATAVGLIAMQSPAVSADEVAKREDDSVELVLVADDDGDDTNDDDHDDGDTFTGNSVSTNDSTRSNFTGVSRDRDVSRGDKTRDWTQDGGEKKRDWSADQTNDVSLNDTRGR